MSFFESFRRNFYGERVGILQSSDGAQHSVLRWYAGLFHASQPCLIAVMKKMSLSVRVKALQTLPVHHKLGLNFNSK